MRMSRAILFALSAMALAVSASFVPAVADIGPVSIGTSYDVHSPPLAPPVAVAYLPAESEDIDRSSALDVAVIKPDRPTKTVFAKCREASYTREPLPVPWRS